MGEQGDHFKLLLRLADGLAGEQFEGQRLQAVAYEQCGRFIEFNVAGRPAAAQHVVVHARQVVMDQRVGVDHFDSAGDDIELFWRCAGQLAGGVGEQHRVVQAGGNAVTAGQEAGEGGFSAILRDGHPFGKRDGAH